MVYQMKIRQHLWRAYLLLCLVLTSFCGFGQKIIGDCTIVYGLKAESKNIDAGALKHASKIFYVRGGMSLTEIRFDDFLQSTIYNKNGDKVYVLSELNDNKYMSVLSIPQWKEQFENYKDLKLEMRGEKKNILGYTCNKAVATLNDGTQINLFYTTALKTTAPENPYEFNNINGLVLEYQALIKNKYKVTYTATHIDFDPVPASKFIIPKEGYRLLDNSMN
ncbi:hypothetical protein D6B99_08350 [Arachidicoccus soli]|uniref:GLPGLI family protein n=2 Tax=Arachidicoccus soli TaxID=2341117 RepID=A0A386HP58_9BACT|nr:hypothetical protein D6B99_08350 [Arachidicoccus soli]